MANVNITKSNQRQKDFDTTGNGFIYADPLKGNYESLIAAIYQRAFIDVFEGRHVTDRHFNAPTIRHNGMTALQFLKDNPYELQYDIETILKDMEKEDFVQKERYNNNELWNL